jgi:transposase
VGRSRGGLTTKIHLLTDGEGRPVRFLLTGGQVADCTQAITLLEGQKTEAVLADKGYDADTILRFIRRSLKAKAVIPPKRNRLVQRRFGKRLYRQRNIIERAFNKLKQWRRIATRYDRCDATFAASIILAAIHIWA